MQLITIGVHQRTAPVVVRERLAFGAASLSEALQRLRTYVDEGMIISTCNRVEVYGLVPVGEPGDQILRRFLAEWHDTVPEELAPHLYTFTGADAARHLFRLAAGLDSMVLGEDQITGQLKAAFAEAQAAGAIGQFLNRLVPNALAAGKLVRTQTAIARNHLSTVSVAVGIAREALGPLDQRNVLIVGAGRMAELALKHLRGDTPATLGIANRTVERAQALADAYGATAWSFDQLEQALRDADVVVSCTSAPEIVIDAAMVARTLAGRDRGLLLLDLAVPRDIDRQAATVPGARLVDIDDMQAICEANRAARVAEVASAETLVEGEVAKFMEWWAAQAVVPTIKALREHAEAIRIAEIERTLARLPDLTPRAQEAIQALSAAIINKLLHQPITTLKAPGSSGELAQAVQQLFQLAEPVGADRR